MVTDPTRGLCFSQNGHHLDNKDQNTLFQIFRVYSNPSIDTSLTCGPHKNLYLVYHSQGFKTLKGVILLFLRLRSTHFVS